jgi:signal transduction histidine kinase
VNGSTEPPREDTGALIHDIRNLLAVIVNYSELIAEETGDPDAVVADIQEVRVAAERAIALTERLPRPPKPGPQSDRQEGAK